ncbi:MAG: adenylate/guanylate cyclase domain-containing protein [Brachymonas sp.]|nr:adenylate/guanylate cyclase domain-containing protein [Brachymonas sp.]
MPTVVFCDLVGSTGLFEKLGDATASHLVTQLNQALGRAITQFEGRVVKTLGDGIFAVFPQENQAVDACCQIQRELHERPLMLFADEKLAVSSGTFRSLHIQLQIGMEAGEVVEINGDCYGDAVNSAARLADLAGAKQILTSQRVHDALPQERRSEFSSLGPMFLRGKEETTTVYRINWQKREAIDPDATMLGVSFADALRTQTLQLSFRGKTVPLAQSGSAIKSLQVGRAATCDLEVSDPRVSRTHASVQVRGNQFVLTDSSSYGTWVYAGGQSEPVVLRRTDCVLVGEGEISLGCERGAPDAAVLKFGVH